MTTQDLIDMLSRGEPLTARTVKTIVEKLKSMRYLEESLDYYTKENERLEDLLAKAEG